MNLKNLKAVWGRKSAFLPYLTILGGLGLVLLAVLVDFIGLGGGDGFGPKQIRLAILGLVITLVGLLTIPTIKHRFLFRWLMPSAPYQCPTQSVPQRMFQILVMAMWFALLTGLIDLLRFADVKFNEHKIIGFGPSVVWMAPAANLAIFGCVFLGLALMSWRWPRLASLRIAFPLFGFLGFLALTFNLPTNLHILSSLMLALGLTVVSTRFIASHPHRFYGLVRRSAVGLGVLTIGLIAGVVGWQTLSERSALASLPPAAPGAPNVLLITLDTVRAKSLSLYGYDKPTSPNLERWAKEGVRFDWAIATAPWTLPSHGSMFTGRFPHELTAGFVTPLDDTYPTLAEVLASDGYDTAGFAANYSYVTREQGLDRGFIHFEDYAVTPGQVFRSSAIVRGILDDEYVIQHVGDIHTDGFGRKDATTINAEFLRWQARRHDQQRPFFAFLNYFDAHDPYLPPPDFSAKFSGKQNPRSDWVVGGELSAQEVQELNGAYDASIAYIDGQLGLLLDELRSKDLLKNTLVIVTSDHGEQFGEHNLMGHANSLYLPLVHVPLIISFPSEMPNGARVSDAVTLRDLPATVLDLVNLPDSRQIPGQSLARFWDNTKYVGDKSGEVSLLSEVEKHVWEEVPARYPTSKGEVKSLVANGMHYIRNGDGEVELYDIKKDPSEVDNLALKEEARPILLEFSKEMDKFPHYVRYRAAAAK